MAVYVDDVRHTFGRMIMCHCWADTEEELFAMMRRIGVNTKWVQRPPKASWLHFDISLAMKARAIEAGAVLTDRYGPLLHVAKLTGNRRMMRRVWRARQGALIAYHQRETAQTDDPENDPDNL